MARNAHYDHLRSVPLFADLGDHELDVVGGATTEIDLKAGHTLIREGEIPHEMFVPVSRPSRRSMPAGSPARWHSSPEPVETPRSPRAPT